MSIINACLSNAVRHSFAKQQFHLMLTELRSQVNAFFRFYLSANQQWLIIKTKTNNIFIKILDHHFAWLYFMLVDQLSHTHTHTRQVVIVAGISPTLALSLTRKWFKLPLDLSGIQVHFVDLCSWCEHLPSVRLATGRILYAHLKQSMYREVFYKEAHTHSICF